MEKQTEHGGSHDHTETSRTGTCGDSVRHYSRRTEDSYVHWIRRFILFHGKRHPLEMGEREITAFLSDLAVAKNVAASTQNQALSAILFLYQKVLEMKLDWLDDVVRAKRPKRLPTVLTRDEVHMLRSSFSLGGKFLLGFLRGGLDASVVA